MKTRLVKIVLTVVIAGSMCRFALAKGDLSMPEKLERADAIVLGQVTNCLSTENLQTEQGTTMKGTLVPLTWIKGKPETGSDAVQVEFYCRRNADGMSALWVLKKGKSGVLQESYPWMRIDPSGWPGLPEPYRAAVLKTVDHAQGAEENGLVLHLMRAPVVPGGPLSVYLVAENRMAGEKEEAADTVKRSIAGRNEISVFYRTSSAILFEIKDPDGKTTNTPLFTRDELNVRANDANQVPGPLKIPCGGYGRVVKTAHDALGRGIVLVESPKPGKYTITAVLQIVPPPSTALANATPPGWSGRATVTMETTVSTPTSNEQEQATKEK